jgi:hypothetical protein
MSQRLPSLPNLDHLKKQAKDVLRVSRHHRGSRWRLTDAQHALARGYGFTDWPELKHRVESMRRPPAAISDTHRASTRRSATASVKERSMHPLVGTWAVRAADRDTPADAKNVVVEFAVADELLVLTQLSENAGGKDVATKLSIRIDGRDHAIPFGESLTLRGSWSGPRTLETIVMHGEQVVAHAHYEVANDGQSLVVSTCDQRLVFDRVEP